MNLKHVVVNSIELEFEKWKRSFFDQNLELVENRVKDYQRKEMGVIDTSSIFREDSI